MTCPCDPKLLYKNCCGIIHNDIQMAQTPEMLMRSRYSAFVLANTAYLSRSHHSSTRPLKREYKEIKRWTQSLDWIRLEIIETQLGKENDTKAFVTFRALFYELGKVQKIQEKSRFSIENGHWVYVDGVHM